MDYKKITEANRQAWNEVTPIHRKNRKTNFFEKFRDNNFVSFDKIEAEKLEQLPIAGKKVAQLCCNNGRETISLIRLGASEAVGFDISDAAIEEANELCRIADANCKFIRTDVYDIGSEWQGVFDVVYITIGALPWLPDLEPFFNTASSLLKPGGRLMLYDGHPILNIFGDDSDEEFDSNHPYKPIFSYFKEDPWIDTTGIDYYGKTRYEAKPSYSYSHSFSKIINAIIKKDVRIDELTEYPHDISNTFDFLEKLNKLPMSFILIGTKI